MTTSAFTVCSFRIVPDIRDEGKELARVTGLGSVGVFKTDAAKALFAIWVVQAPAVAWWTIAETFYFCFRFHGSCAVFGSSVHKGMHYLFSSRYSTMRDAQLWLVASLAGRTLIRPFSDAAAAMIFGVSVFRFHLQFLDRDS